MKEGHMSSYPTFWVESSLTTVMLLRETHSASFPSLESVSCSGVPKYLSPCQATAVQGEGGRPPSSS